MPVTAWSRDELSRHVDAIDRASRELEHAHPNEIVRYAYDLLGGDLVVTCSFEDAVLAHVAATAVPDVDVVMLDTQYLFAETHWFAEELRRDHGVRLRIVQPIGVKPDNLWQTDTEGCCHIRKVEPLNRLLADHAGWVTGVRRADGPTRAHAPVLSYDAGRNVLKVNPLALLSDDYMRTYEQIHDLPRNPLSERGYPSIGCWPCTRPVAPGEDKRAGRWTGQAKTECGLHV